MKRILIILAAALSLSSCGLLSNINWNEQALSAAAGHAMTAASLTEDQIVSLCQQSVAQLDQQNKIDNGAYHKRLAKILDGITSVGDQPLNFKVYITDEVNAFASGDGSIRVYSGLMDLMDDSEVMAVLGHEMGHVIEKHSMRAMKRAYMTTAAREAVYAAGGVVGGLAASVVGELADAYVNAQYSQKQEYKADEYGFLISIERGLDPYSMYNSLMKLQTLSSGSNASAAAQMFSSHPDNASRAERMKKAADDYVNKSNK